MNIYVTFGQIHAHSVNGKTFDKDCVAVINCDNYGQGRRLAVLYFDNEFHQSIAETEFNYKNRDGEFMSFFPRGLINAN
ncbi:hypothetical protein LCGC14_1915080 [marine sediment metagenome]|uniref:Uncharacterized protein n=1 Tax=marine sediment metagenome TaxID=412755 RepID=A0A0F9I6I1_9ZZZZ